MLKGRLGVVATRQLIAGLFIFFGGFLLCSGVGGRNIVLALAGLLIGGLAAALRFGAGLRPRSRQWLPATGRVALVADDPPATGDYGPCELHLIVEAQGAPSERVVVRDSRVPVANWPYPGMELPIEVASDNIRTVRVQWSRLAPSSSEDDFWVADQPDPVPRQSGSYLEPPDELIDFDIDDDLSAPGGPTASDEGDPLAAPRHRPSPRPREAAEPAAVAAAAIEPPPVTGAAPAAEPAPVAAAAATAVVEPAVDDLITTYPSAHPGPSGAIHGVGVTLLVADLARSLGFYRDLLGFYEVDSGDGNVVLASGGTRLVLRASSELGRISRRSVHLNLEVGDIDAVYAELKANGVRFTYPPRVVNRSNRLELWGAAFRDPDGHGIAIAQWRTPESV